MDKQQRGILKALHVLFSEGEHVTELRALGVPEDWSDGGFTHSGYFDDLEALATAAARLDRKGARAVYVTPNPVKPDLLARAKNRTVRSPKSTTTNDEIQRRRWLLLDFDPKRPAGISSTDEELRAARRRAVEVARFLKGKDFPGGVLAESGNGAHLMYRIDLPPEDGGLTKRVLAGVAERFPEDEAKGVPVKVDTGVYNAARLWKLYGTTARKGDPTEERPHRRARIIRVADSLEVVPKAKLEAVAAPEAAAAGESPSHRAAPVSGHSGAAGAKPEGLTEEEVREALEHVPPRPDYDEWFRITAAVYDAVDKDADAAERLLKAWSAEEKPGEYQKILGSDLDGSITAGTLLREAKRHGYAPRPNGRSGQGRRERPPRNSNAAGEAESASTAREHRAVPSSFALENAPPLPDDVYAELPGLLREPAFMFSRRHKRDVFLTGALGILSGCLPNVEGYYGADVPGALSPNLYAAVVAKSAGGKSALKWGRRLAAKTNELIKTASERARINWKERKEYAESQGEDFSEPEPPERSLFLPADTSASFLFRALKDRGERAVLYSSEIETLANAIGQEWGKFDALLRQAYHHEGKGFGRTSEGSPLWIERPAVSVVLSGTPKQFSGLMAGSAENGLYNRFLVYYFDAAEPWRSQRPTAAGIERLERLEALAGRVRELYEMLESRAEPLRFEMDVAAWERREAVFAPLLRKARLLGIGALEGVAFRAGIWAFRISMILTALRGFERGADLKRAAALSPSPEDVEAGLSLAKVYADHALRFGSERLSDATPDPRMERVRLMLEGVGQCFSSGEAYRAYEVRVPKGQQKSRRTLRRDLKYAARQRLIRAASANGDWQQVDPAQSEASKNRAASDLSDLSDWRSGYEDSVGSDTSDASEAAPTGSTQGGAAPGMNESSTSTGALGPSFERGQRVKTPEFEGAICDDEPSERGRWPVRPESDVSGEAVRYFSPEKLTLLSGENESSAGAPF